MESQNYIIKQVGIDDQSIRESASLLNLCFPNSTNIETFDFVKWEYCDNPEGTIVGFNAYNNGDLAAHYVAQPISIVVNGERVRGLLSLNTATHPNHRGKRLFTILAERTYQYASENGYKFVIGVANANSTHGFVKYLGFRLIGPLTFKVGMGKGIYPKKDYTFTRYWDKEIMDWRLKNPSYKYFKNGDVIVSPIKPGFKKLVFHDADGLANLNKLHGRPFNLYIGFGADLRKGIYCGIPKFIEHSPFNLIFRDLTDGSLPEVTKDNILFELIDFDVA